MLKILHKLFKRESRKDRARKALLLRLAQGVPEMSLEKRDSLIDLVSQKNFSLFLEYLELTISENLVTLSNMDILDDRMRTQAVRLQNQMRGVLLVRDLVDDLITTSKALAREAEEERNNE